MARGDPLTDFGAFSTGPVLGPARQGGRQDSETGTNLGTSRAVERERAEERKKESEDAYGPRSLIWSGEQRGNQGWKRREPAWRRSCLTRFDGGTEGRFSSPTYPKFQPVPSASTPSRSSFPFRRANRLSQPLALPAWRGGPASAAVGLLLLLRRESSFIPRSTHCIRVLAFFSSCSSCSFVREIEYVLLSLSFPLVLQFSFAPSSFLLVQQQQQHQQQLLLSKTRSLFEYVSRKVGSLRNGNSFRSSVLRSLPQFYKPFFSVLATSCRHRTK